MPHRPRPVGFKDFKTRFGSDADCANFLLETRFAPEFVCAQCGTARRFQLFMADLRIKCAGCSRSHYLRAGTLMEGSCLPLRKWFEAMWLVTVTRTGLTTEFLSSYLGITPRAAHRMRGKIQQHMAWLCQQAKAGEDGRQVYLDDTRLKGIRWPGAGSGRKATLVGIWDGRRMIADTIPSRLPKHVLALVHSYISPGARLASNGADIYRLLKSRAYFDQAQRSDFQRSPEFDRAMEFMFAFWMNLKRTVRGTHGQLRYEYLRLYVKEFEYRYNYRRRPADMFWDLVSTHPRIDDFKY